MERLSKWREIVYSGGNAGFSLLDNLFGVYFIFFLLPPAETGLPQLIDNSPLLLGMTAIGLIILFGRVIDSIADPLVAHWSDNARFKMGRRKFFMVTGALPFALATALLFFTPEREISGLNIGYELVALGVYFFFYTYFMTPYLALIPELSRTHADRIFITVVQAAFAIVGAALVMMGVPLLWDIFKETFGNQVGLQTALAVVSGVGFVFLIFSGLVIDEGRFTKSEPADVPLLESLRMTISNRTFMVYLIPVILYWFAFHIIRSIIAYYPVVLLGEEQGFQTLLTVVLFASAVVYFILIAVFSRYISNKAILLIGLLSFAVFMTFTYFVDGLGEFRKTAALIHMALLGLPVSILLVIPNALVADISEVDAFERGMSREAMFFGTQGFLMKVNYGIAAMIVSYLFAVFGKDAANPLGVKLSGPVAAIFALAGFIIFLRYPQRAMDDKLKTIRAGKGS